LVGEQNGKKVIRAHDHYSIDPQRELINELVRMLGNESVYLTVGEAIRTFPAMA